MSYVTATINILRVDTPIITPTPPSLELQHCIHDPYWTPPSSPSPSYDWYDTQLHEMAVYYPNSSGP